jgi:hypothetical protein
MIQRSPLALRQALVVVSYQRTNPVAKRMGPQSALPLLSLTGPGNYFEDEREVLIKCRGHWSKESQADD